MEYISVFCLFCLQMICRKKYTFLLIVIQLSLLILRINGSETLRTQKVLETLECGDGVQTGNATKQQINETLAKRQVKGEDRIETESLLSVIDLAEDTVHSIRNVL